MMTMMTPMGEGKYISYQKQKEKTILHGESFKEKKRKTRTGGYQIRYQKHRLKKKKKKREKKSNQAPKMISPHNSAQA
jgi:hypothetical protein